MFKNIILYIAALSLAHTTYAQKGVRQIISYEAEGIVYYQLTNFSPLSPIAFYSEKSGGTCLKKDNVDKSGKVEIQGDEKFKPSFVLNEMTKDNNTGDGTVMFIGDKEFGIDHISIDHKNSNVILSWESEVSDIKAYVFTILRSNDNVTYKPIAILPAKSTKKTTYSYSDLIKTGESVSYKIKISSSKNEATYISNVFSATENGFTLYPSLAKENISLIFNNRVDDANYSIISMQGEVVASGKINSDANTIAVNNLVTGNYLLKVEDLTRKSIYAARFIKE